MLNAKLTCKVGTRLEMLRYASRRWISTSFAEGPFVEGPRPWLFVGLGNPGQKFQGTRHNIGFEMIDAFAESEGISLDTVHCKALFGKGLVGNTPVFLAKPQTYMNLSGESSGPLAAYYKLPLSRVLLAFDDMDLPCGVLRLQPKGGHGGHNGEEVAMKMDEKTTVALSLMKAQRCLLAEISQIYGYLPPSKNGTFSFFVEATNIFCRYARLRSVIYHFRGNREFARLRIGIGKPPGQMDPKAFLLQKFNATARERIDAALKEGVEALRHLIFKGLAESSRRFNNEQKYKHCSL